MATQIEPKLGHSEAHEGLTLLLDAENNQYGRVDATIRRSTKGESKEDYLATFAACWKMVQQQLLEQVRDLQKAFNVKEELRISTSLEEE